MTARISQSVVPRHRPTLPFAHSLSSLTGTWHARQLRGPSMVHSQWKTNWQRGSVTQSTMTITFSLLALSLVAMLGFFYLHQVFNTASQDSEIQQLQSTLSDLHNQQRQLELEGAEDRSIQKVEQRVKDLQLQPSDHVSYLVPQTQTLAVVAQ